MDSKGTVTVSEVVERETRDGKAFEAAVYVECSFCRELDHLMKIHFYWERDKSDELAFNSVDFSFPSEWYTHQPWVKVKRGLPRVLQRIGEGVRRVKLAWLVLRGKEIRLSQSIDLELPAVRDLGNKLSHLSTIAMRDYGAKGDK